MAPLFRHSPGFHSASDRPVDSVPRHRPRFRRTPDVTPSRGDSRSDNAWRSSGSRTVRCRRARSADPSDGSTHLGSEAGGVNGRMSLYNFGLHPIGTSGQPSLDPTPSATPLVHCGSTRWSGLHHTDGLLPSHLDCRGFLYWSEFFCDYARASAFCYSLAVRRVLVCWIGHTDLRAPEESEAVWFLGPVAQALGAGSYDDAFLLSRFVAVILDNQCLSAPLRHLRNQWSRSNAGPRLQKSLHWGKFFSDPQE